MGVVSFVRRSVNFDNLGVRHSVSLCRSYTDCTNNIAQFRQSLIVLFVCPAMRDVPYASRNTQSALTTVNIVNDFGSFYMYSWYKKESSSCPYSNQHQVCSLPEQQKHQKRNAMHLACSARLYPKANVESNRVVASANKWQALQFKVNIHTIIPVICKIIYQRVLVIRVKSSIFIKTFNN